MPLRINLEPVCNTNDKVIKKNIKQSRRYQSVEWADPKTVLFKPPCAVVGGSPNLPSMLHVLRKWKGDIFAINATAGYLSDQGIPCFLYAIDCDPNPWRIGPLVKGALFATRVHRNQFKQFKRKDIRTFHMAEDDNRTGVEGGPTAVCRTPHLFLRMGYRAVVYFGIDGCFTHETHITGTDKLAYGNMVIVRAGGIDYITNAAFLLQHQYMVEVLTKHPQFLVNASGGLLAAMLKYPDTWEVVAIADDLKAQYASKGIDPWTKEYVPNVDCLWRPVGYSVEA